MFRSKIKTSALILAVALAANAQFNVPQNARMDALGGAPLSDISGIFSYPSLMVGYTEHFQASWGGGVIGVKAVNDVISVGILANQGLMAPEFANAAVGRINTYIAGAPGGGPGFTTAFNIPHLLLGFNLGTASVGADVFFEYAGYSGSIDAPGGTTTYKASIIHPGARLSAGLGFGAIDLLAKLGIGFPSMGAEASNNTDRLSSNAGLYMEAGAELTAPMGNIDLTFGGDYTTASRRFQAGTNIDPDLVSGSLLSLYVSGEFNFVETAVAAIQYMFLREAQTTSLPDAAGAPSNTAPASHLHVFSAGIENVWEKAWIFDSFQVRGGARYAAEFGVGKSSGIPADTDIRFSRAGIHEGITPTLGIGASKEFFTLDLSLNMGSWTGVFAGPAVGVVTGTIKF